MLSTNQIIALNEAVIDSVVTLGDSDFRLTRVDSTEIADTFTLRKIQEPNAPFTLYRTIRVMHVDAHSLTVVDAKRRESANQARLRAV